MNNWFEKQQIWNVQWPFRFGAQSFTPCETTVAILKLSIRHSRNAVPTDIIGIAVCSNVHPWRATTASIQQGRLYQHFCEIDWKRVRCTFYNLQFLHRMKTTTFAKIDLLAIAMMDRVRCRREHRSDAKASLTESQNVGSGNGLVWTNWSHVEFFLQVREKIRKEWNFLTDGVRSYHFWIFRKGGPSYFETGAIIIRLGETRIVNVIFTSPQ